MRVEEMKEVRMSLMARLEADKLNREEIQDGIKHAHEEDVKEHKVLVKKQKKKAKKKAEAAQHVEAVSPINTIEEE